MASAGSSTDELSEGMLEEESESTDFNQMIKNAHPDRGGSKEQLQRVLEQREKHRERKGNGDDDGLLGGIFSKGREAYSSLTERMPSLPGSFTSTDHYIERIETLFSSEDRNEEEKAHSLPEPGIEFEMQEEYEKLVDVNGINHEHAVEALEYDGNTQLARKALETEWKIRNVRDYLDWDSFSEGSLAGEAELLLSEYNNEQRERLIKELAEESSEEYGEITKVWTQENHSHLMGYSKNKGKNVKLIDSYKELDERIEQREESLTDIVRETKDQVDEYGKAAIKSIIDPEIRGEIEDQELLRYAESRIG